MCVCVCVCACVGVKFDMVHSLPPPPSHKRYDLWKNFVEHKMRVLIFSTTFTRNISYSEKNSARYCRKCT